jgi:hypothetical protein
MSKDWTGSAMVATNSRHKEELVAEGDFYATHRDTVREFFDIAKRDFGLGGRMWEPACGQGDISEVAKSYFDYVYSTDLTDRGYGDETGVDFLDPNTCGPEDLNYIVTNPPYKYSMEFWKKAMNHMNPGGRVIFLCKLTWLETAKRRDMFKQYPLEYVYVLANRIACKAGGWENGEKMVGGAAAYAWYVGTQGYKGDVKLRWI